MQSTIKRHPWLRGALSGPYVSSVDDISPIFFNSTTLSDDEFLEKFRLCFGLELLGLRNRFDCCGTKIT